MGGLMETGGWGWGRGSGSVGFTLAALPLLEVPDAEVAEVDLDAPLLLPLLLLLTDVALDVALVTLLLDWGSLS